MDCLHESLGTDFIPGNGVFYNTLVAIDVVNPNEVPDGQTLKGERIVPQLFYVSLRSAHACLRYESILTSIRAMSHNTAASASSKD